MSKESAASEMRIAYQGKIGGYLSYGHSLLDGEGFVCIKATGQAVTKAITVAELLKRKQGGLHQITEVETVQLVNEKTNEKHTHTKDICTLR